MKKTSDTTTTASASETAELIYFLTPEQLSDAIKSAGCSVTALEHNGVPHLHSASQGVGFQVLWGNAGAAAGQFIDFTMSCPLRVQGGVLPEGLIAEWHRSKRFARIVEHGEMISLEMDVIVVGGVSPTYLSMMVQLWTQMMGQFFLHLRNFASQDPAVAPAGQPAVLEEATPA
ncbi:YbjN domain-containing protein [Herbaspirillum sp. RV1423]|uniref:YbjN domain-containing protein n=1 Tax=Herbaspirillum sp. RV1423 TaxID=1443993 RepID=UPI0004B9727D|nr:YbjN domain-containing protein [Herbaspirillum sp. RV1423]